MTVDKLNEKLCMTFVGDVSFTELPTSIRIGEFMDMRLYVSPGSYFLPNDSVDPDLFWPAWAVPTCSHAGDATLLVKCVSKAVHFKLGSDTFEFSFRVPVLEPKSEFDGKRFSLVRALTDDEVRLHQTLSEGKKSTFKLNRRVPVPAPTVVSTQKCSL